MDKSPDDDRNRSNNLTLTLKPTISLNEKPSRNPSSEIKDNGQKITVDDDDRDNIWRPKPPKVLMENPKETPLELRAQIQHYATNE